MYALLLEIIGISLSGVMVPGPITAATLAAGARSRHAGAMIALGHAVVEMPLIAMLAAGVGTFLRSPAVNVGIGLAGGAMLVLMAVQLFLSIRRCESGSPAAIQRRPFVTGIVLTGANPYFLIWWATIGLALAAKAAAYGAAVLLTFAVIHWLCDLVWLEVLSAAGHQGSKAFGLRSKRVISVVCAVALFGFGVKFLYDGGITLLQFGRS